MSSFCNLCRSDMTKPGQMFATISLIQINSLLTVPRGLTGILPESTNPRDLTDGLPESTKRPGMLSLPVLPVYYVIFLRHQILLRRNRRVRSIRRSRNDLPQCLGPDIACGKNARLTCSGIFPCHNISCLICL